MQELEQLIEKFWTGRTTEAENQRLLQLLEHDGGEHRQRILEVFGQENGSPDGKIDEERARRLLDQIHTRYNIGRAQPLRLPWLRQYRTAIAVAAVLFIGAGIALFQQQRPAIAPAKTPVVAAQPARLIRLSNTSDSAMTISLQDGSMVQLQKNSGISYYEPFINSRRDISLLGAALFKVAKDKSRPFSVYAGGTVTRVLGTRFLVNARGDHKVTVRLLEGSIAVQPQQTSGKGEEKGILLRTGQEIAVNQLDHSYTINTVPPAGNDRAPHAKKDNSGLAFSKEPLKQVFRKIGTAYGITFSYDPKEMDGLYFTGIFLRSDELNSVLATICNVNDLSFKQEGDTVRISRLH
jgi:ferric-dicitrate binding protein FerR (iron transport regulator)